ncbi:DEAD/DEAH box helicase [Nesterenkonia sp. NBAIMH1]|uniref:DEAD/DEAH box helicase n=1 Tax=Nesterenkonia sp. NBAIMH1 TaxID=2600320 RepID=UPI001FEEA55A|nr:DEAD/DEAH box helicase [Nesterenkonia sp. NBAIMH1]
MHDADPEDPLTLLREAGLGAGLDSESSPLRHVRTLPARQAAPAEWPLWTPEPLRAAYRQVGIPSPYAHQALAAEALHSGEHVILATGTASGKSLAAQLPALSAILGAEPGPSVAAHPAGEATVLYLSPTKALAADQLDGLRELAETVGAHGPAGGIRAEAYDGDTDPQSRAWVRQHANFILSNPDMLNAGILPNHRGWARFFARLRYVMIDEAHTARGIFGSHLALLLRRLRRVARHYGADPVFVGASATSGDPATSFARLIGETPEAVTAITHDGSPHGAVDVYLWEAADAVGVAGDNGAPVKRSLTVEAADLMTNLVVAGRRSLAFIKSRRGAETIARIAEENLAEVDASLVDRVSAYRSGYLKEERRELEHRLRTGQLLGVASTPALELGIDISGLDAVVIAGWPGTRASFFQQLGRAGRSGQRGAAFFIGGDEPLDSYLLAHPEAIFDRPVEDAVTDPSNPHVAAPHLLAAAQELPLVPADIEDVGLFAGLRWLVESLTEQGHLRRRPRGWFFNHDDVSAASWVKLRSDGAGPYTIVNAEDGTVVGDMGSAQAQPQAHPQAVYVHQGRTYVVEELDLDQNTVLVVPANPPYYTQARETTSISVMETQRTEAWNEFTLCFGTVEVTSTVVGFQRKALGSSEVISDEPLELPPSTLRTQAMWLTAPETTLQAGGVIVEHVPGSLHAAEHAMIGLLPLLSSSDRWDIGGVSTALHADTELPSIFVYDGHPGGAGFAQRGFELAAEWVRATAEAIEACSCSDGCPSCVQSPKCGNRNSPLSKQGALNLLRTALKHHDAERAGEAGRPVWGHSRAVRDWSLPEVTEPPEL